MGRRFATPTYRHRRCRNCRSGSGHATGPSRPRCGLIERAPELTAVGAGLLLQPSGLDILDELGCRGAIEQYGRRIDGLYGTTPSGRAVMHVRYSDLDESPQPFGLGVHRAALCHVLDTALAAEPHQRWFGCEVTAIDADGGRPNIRLRHNGNDEHAAFDAVIVANGCASRLRPPELVRYDRQYPWGAMWLIRPITRELAAFDAPMLQQRYSGSSTMLGVVPSGCLPDDPETPLMSLLWSLPVGDIDAWQAGALDLDEWKRRVSGLWPELEPLVYAIQDASELLPATYRDVIMSRWGRGRVGVISDAAHAMSPQLGQGANMALLDASALARAVAASRTWEDVWGDYYRQRRGSVRFYQRMSRLLTPFFQSRIPGAAMLRDAGMPLARYIPWLRRQMAKTVAGRKTRWLR